MKFAYATGATPLDPDEITGLIPLHITTQNQLNEWVRILTNVNADYYDRERYSPPRF
jgi:hypothetical protein